MLCCSVQLSVAKQLEASVCSVHCKAVCGMAGKTGENCTNNLCFTVLYSSLRNEIVLWLPHCKRDWLLMLHKRCS